MTGTVIVQGTTAGVFTSLRLTPATATMLPGGTVQLTATPLDQNGTAMAGLPAATFTSSNAAIATVSATGLGTGVGAGTATLTASLTANGVTLTATASVTVSAPPTTGASVTTPSNTFSPAIVTINAGETVTWFFSGTVHNVTFNGAAPTGGNIPDQQVGASVSRTFPTAGTHNYECTRHSGMTGTVIVQGTTAGVFTSLRLTPATATMLPGGTVQLTATPLDQNGTAMTGLPAATFTSSSAAIATVSATGLGTGVGAGTATLTASLTANGVTMTATASVTVGAISGATVTTSALSFQPERVTIRPGESVTWQFSGTVHNVVFIDRAPPQGNIPDTQPGQSVSRTFPSADQYDYRCTLHEAMKGRVIVEQD
ncbi:MAG: plastocyanin/azurin family copper-binding protein [Gemmatimonadaceae bacterium]